MSETRSTTYLVALLLIAIPAAMHAVYQGVYETDYVQIFWIGPISTTVNYAYLVVLFLMHCSLLESTSRKSAYCGVGLAWVSMVGFTIFIIAQSPAPKLTSGVVFAVRLSSLHYLPYIALPYLIGATLGWLWTKWEERKLRNARF